MTLAQPAMLAALGARTLLAQQLPAQLQIVTDTRAIAGGDTFLALIGERFDGHDFVNAAFERGAAACIVSDAARVPADRPAIIVEDTLATYLQLARLARRRIRGRVVAITGSAGKTTTKAFLLQLLQAAGIASTATPENENNEIGVSKFLIGLDEGDARVAIVEMGARKFGDIDVLVEAAEPDVSILTNVGEAHLEIFGSRERLAHTTWGVFRTHARAVLNLSDEVSRSRAAALPVTPIWFGTGSLAPPPGEPGVVVRDARCVMVHDGIARTEFDVDITVPGEHNRRNAAAALAGAIALGYPPAALVPHLAALHLPPGRYQRIPLAQGDTLVFDAYNASMSGTLATLHAFAEEPAQRRIAVLGSMAELGPEAPQMHRRVGRAAAGSSDVILVGGEFAADMERGALDAGTAAHAVVRYADNADAIEWLRLHARAGDAILLKGSRKYKMEEIAAALGAQAFA
ncbi:MAG: UDP-N-acetylmuramoyl-tripeptide--D-alanyl-D-alanine ligase [Candidatus Velthaea sp.]